MGGERGFDQGAIDAVAKLQLLFERLDVNITRLFLERLDEDEIHDLDDGGVFAFDRQPVEIDIVALH